MEAHLEIGRRIERLLYFAAVLVLLCLALVYFVSTAAYMSSANPNGFAILEKNLAAEMSGLREKYNHPVTRATPSSEERVLAVQATRKKLGLPTETLRKPQSSKVETYQDELKGVVSKSSAESGVSVESLSQDISASMSPDQVMDAIRHRRDQLSKTPASIWGIETPLIVPLEYGAARYSIPASVIANSLLIAIAPLIIWWLGSFHLTRRRELIFIREEDNYRSLFPHILNILPIVYIGAPWATAKERAGRNNQRLQRVGLQVTCSLMRSFVIILVSWPMVAMYIYSAVQIIELQANPSVFELALAFAIGAWMFVQALSALLQEWIILWGKVYTAYWR